ncbi:hypothetical protein PR048_013271 [Dryococelus australis]|uniref:Uncharacterized protein n=1 Tax=Dryococelus australis TaxID=614101 RepID=A0ABQ9HRP7_9NEOP|nr:hypothetical protein PR048_013271 [Dryococelus australis]
MKNPKPMLMIAFFYKSGANMGQLMRHSTERLRTEETSGGRILNVISTLATCNLAFHGTSERLEHSNKGNFLLIIELLSKMTVLQELLRHPCGAFLSLNLDKTQYVSKADQLSEVYRYIKIEKDVENLERFALKKCSDQGYDGAAMRGVYNAHNLNLVLQDAVKENREINQFLKPLKVCIAFLAIVLFGQKELKTMYQSGCPKVTLKTLNPTCWAGRFVDAESVFKHRFCDGVKCLSHLTLTSKKRKTRMKAWYLIIQYEVLKSLNIVSKSLPSETVDLLSAHGECYA